MFMIKFPIFIVFCSKIRAQETFELGVANVTTKWNISLIFSLGAKKEGGKGFFKGLGKGLIGVVARPVGGAVDMASSTFEGLKR